MKRLAFCAVFMILAALFVSGCGKAKTGDGKGLAVIQNKGSDTIVNVAQAWAEEYKKVEPSVEIEVSGGGSGVGIAALTRGAIDIANASRNMKKAEIEAVKANTGSKPIEFVVGYDALAIFVHKSNPMETITMEEIAEIYQEGGKITQWSDMGVTMSEGHDKIIRVSRQSSSGTYEFLRKKALKDKDFKLGSCDLNGSKEVVELVANTPGAIGYSGMGYANSKVKMLKVAPKAGEPGISPTQETTLDKTYPIARSLLMYTLGEPRDEVRKYLDWILSDGGQALIRDAGYVPVRILNK